MELRDGRVRKLRGSCDDPGNAHELTFSCYQRRPFLESDRTRQWCVDALAQVRRTHDLELWAYVIMPEHVHLLMLPRQDDYRVADILKSIKQSVARRAVRYMRESCPERLGEIEVVRPSGRREYRFWQQGGGFDRNVVRWETAWAMVEYIHNNPVRRGLVGSATDWVWSSARWYAGDTDAILAMDGCPE